MLRVNENRNQTKPETLQEDFQTISEFVRRTDDLSHRVGLNLSEIHGILGISKAMVFAYRSGKSRITGKVWRKLMDAEHAAGIDGAPPAENAESSTDPKESGIGDSAHEESVMLREDAQPYRAQVNPVAEAFTKIRDGLDLLEQLMKELGK